MTKFSGASKSKNMTEPESEYGSSVLPEDPGVELSTSGRSSRVDYSVQDRESV